MYIALLQCALIIFVNFKIRQYFFVIQVFELWAHGAVWIQKSPILSCKIGVILGKVDGLIA